MREVIINGRAYPSIWRDENAPKKETAITVKYCRRAYKDPTANTALGNIVREEKQKKRREQQAQNRKRQK